VFFLLGSYPDFIFFIAQKATCFHPRSRTTGYSTGILINSKNFHELKDLYCTGATQMALTNEGLAKIKVIKPTPNIVIRFGEIVLPAIDQLFNLQIMNKNLRRTRDLLLPKLISGEIDVE